MARSAAIAAPACHVDGHKVCCVISDHQVVYNLNLISQEDFIKCTMRFAPSYLAFELTYVATSFRRVTEVMIKSTCANAWGIPRTGVLLGVCLSMEHDVAVAGAC